MTLHFVVWGLIRSLKRDYMATMTFARQQAHRHLLELAAFSLPAFGAALLILMPLRTHQATIPQMLIDVAPVAPSSPRQETAAQVVQPISKAEPLPVATPIFEVPSLETKPYEGLGPTVFGRRGMAAPNMPPAVPHEVTVKAGHSLWAIARDVYGNGRDFIVILSANRKSISNPDLIHPGQQLVLPDKKAN